MFPYWKLTMHLPNPITIHDPLPPIEIDGEQEYEVDDILDSKIYNHQI
jgi:hypothetical protein